MVKKIRLLGMEMDHFTLREEMMQSETFSNKQQLNIIRTVSMEMLSMAAGSQTVREGIEQADLLIVGNREILTEAGIYSGQRLREASEHGFMHEFLKQRMHSGNSFFLVAQCEKDLHACLQFLKTKYETMKIVGTYLLDACSADCDIMINEINASAPDIILSVLGSPQEDLLLLEEKSKIRAKIWYSLGDSYRNEKKRRSFLLWFRQLIYKGRFKNLIHNYEEKNVWK